MSRIVFEVNDGSEVIGVTRQQLKTILKESKESPVRVLSHAPSPIVEVYVGEFYHELTRHHVNEHGRILFTETDPKDEGEWE